MSALITSLARHLCIINELPTKYVLTGCQFIEVSEQDQNGWLGHKNPCTQILIIFYELNALKAVQGIATIFVIYYI